MTPQYIVAGPEYWDSIPKTRQLSCGRVRFTNSRCPPPEGAGVYDLKADAMKDAGVPIDIVSTGPDREETIVLRHPFRRNAS